MDDDKPHVLSEKTLIPLSAIGILCGAIVWVTTIYAQGVSNSKAIEEIRKNQDNYMEGFTELKADVSYIRGFIEKRQRNAKEHL